MTMFRIHVAWCHELRTTYRRVLSNPCDMAMNNQQACRCHPFWPCSSVWKDVNCTNAGQRAIMSVSRLGIPASYFAETTHSVRVESWVCDTRVFLPKQCLTHRTLLCSTGGCAWHNSIPNAGLAGRHVEHIADT